MRNILITFYMLMCLGVNAQTHNPLRDSLSVAIQELSYRPDSIDLRLKKAAWNLELKQWDYALAEYNYVLKLEPKNVAALFYRAYVYEKLHKYKFARADYETLLAIVPGNFEARLGFALLCQKDHHYTEAIDMLNSLCEQYPERGEVFAARAGVETERGQYELAEYDYGEALLADPDNVDYLYARAEVRLKLNRPAGARDDLDQLLRLGVAPREVASLYNKTRKNKSRKIKKTQ